MAKPLQKERENRSADKKDLSFHPFTITPETAHTSILLLESKEPEILCQTLRALTKFAAQDMQNRYQLFGLDAINFILPHVDHPEINIRRFALKALGQMCQLQRGPEQVLEDPQNLRRIAFLLPKTEDVFVLEFASLVLSELTKEPIGCEQLISANILGSLCNRMKNSLDPDVQKNCLQILSNVLCDPTCAPEVTKNPQLSWAALLALTQSKYLAIQHAALHTVDQLICRYNDAHVQKSFKASTGVLDLCDILESYEFRDVHTQVLGVLRTYVETEDNAEHFYQAGCINRLLAYLEMALPAMKSHTIAVLTKMSFTESGRNALYDTGTDLVFCHHLLSTNVDLLADAAMGVANMTKLPASATRMADTNIVEALCAIIADDSSPWFDIRMNAMRALCELGRIIPKAAFNIVENKNFVPLRNVIRKSKDVPIEAQRLVLQCFINLQGYSTCLKAMLNPEFIGEMLATLQRIDINLKIKAATVITGLMGEESAKYMFTSKKGEEEGFYVQKRLGDYFPCMEELLESRPADNHPVYVCMFYTSHPDHRSSMDIRTPYTSQKSKSNLRISTSSRIRMPPIPDDVNLRTYLLRLRMWFGDPAKSMHYFEIDDAHYEVRYREKCSEVSSSLKQRAQLLAEFVAEQMCGLTQERDCSLPSVELHLADLMLDLKSHIIGIGWVKCGGPLERAILYKVLADRIGLPCALFRGSGAHAWCEVAVPDLDPEEPPVSENYPSGLLRRNYVVDLMSSTGRLVPLGTRDAQLICGPSCAPLYVARCPPTVCKCVNSCDD